MFPRRVLVLSHAAVLALLVAPTASAQTTTCKTGNCAVGKMGSTPNLPTECQTVAKPRTIEIAMGSGGLRFVPANARIEGQGPAGARWEFQCVRWRKVDAAPWHSATESTAGSTCSTALACSTTNITPPCDFETGNIDSPLEYSVCHYRDVAPASYPFLCRLHAGVGMNGSLTVVAPIQLRIEKGVAGAAILDWTTGGVGPWDVWRDETPDMPVAASLAPGTVTRTFTDTAPPATAFYLVIERN